MQATQGAIIRERVNTKNAKWTAMKNLQQLSSRSGNDPLAQFETEKEGKGSSDDVWAQRASYRPIIVTRYQSMSVSESSPWPIIAHKRHPQQDPGQDSRWRRRDRARWSRPPSTPPTRRPAARKLLLDGVGAGIVERVATKSRWPRLGTVFVLHA
jgi:hypothetical protein